MALSIEWTRRGARRCTFGIVERRHLVGEQLRRGQRVAQVVVDLGDGEAEIGEVPALPQHGEDVGLHRREFVLDDADLVLALGRR